MSAQVCETEHIHVVHRTAMLDEIAQQVGPEPGNDLDRATWEQRLTNPAVWEKTANNRHARFVLEWNARRLAMLDRDVGAIIATQSGAPRSHW